ncbi:testis-specific serine/threonine-protein kinase 3 isoform X2 [Crotalus tigris]|uniref:testis-specific serine/threonine-protein kinase 3 isoform X2 n=1 Tax=Crotalus tigris TaxID=88082 RepID=UPI00192F5694|nr:testis-specific serine/threonine-protein kinase 3 isoform X2 [Crotalus tigris]
MTDERVKDTMEEFLLSHGYQMGKTIGEGTYSKVKEAFSKKHQRKVAVKIIDKLGGPEEFIERFLPRELQIVKRLDHKNIIRVYEMLESTDGKIYLVMELAENGDVFDCVLQGGPLPESRAKALFRQLVEAIRYCHSCGVAHRDLKCENALLQGLNLKLTDFGFAKLLPKNRKELSQTFCGSTAYAAPEVLQGVPHDSRKGDVWSMGVVLYVMLCANLPFDDTDIPKMLCHQQKGVSIPGHLGISEECQDLLKSLLEPDMILRPSIEEDSSWAVLQ